MIGERVKLAREACGLTQQQLTDRTGVPLSTIAHIEIGRILRPSDDALSAISAATGFPAGFFFRGPLPDLPDGNYRKFARGTSRAEKQVRALTRQMVEIVQWSDEVLSLPALEIHALPELGSIDDIEYHVLGVRDSLRVGHRDPIPHLIRAVERSGIVVLRLPVTMEDHEGFSVWPYFGLSGARPVIVATGEHTGDRDRFTVAHELGHLVLHSSRRGVNPGQAETEANRFAGALLIPEQVALEALQPPLTLDVLMGVKATFGVSMQALTMRAFDLRLIDESHRASIYKQLSRRGWRTDEPVAVPKEQPILMPQIVEELGGDGPIEDRAETLGMPTFALSALLALMQPATENTAPQTQRSTHKA